jgi:hypothetical protein
MKTSRWLWVFIAILVVCVASPANFHFFLRAGGAAVTHASPPGAQESTSELEESLFVQDAHLKSGKKGVLLVWIPQPLQKFCLGKTLEQCAAMDYCIRTTSKNVATCKNLPVSLRNLPSYPPGMRPARVLSITYSSITPDNKIAPVMDYLESAPAGSLDRFSLRGRVKAKVKLTRKADDDQFDVLEILSVPSS